MYKQQQPGRGTQQQQQQPGRGTQSGKPSGGSRKTETIVDIVQYDATIPESGEAGGDVPILLADPFPNYDEVDSVKKTDKVKIDLKLPEQPNFLYDPPKRG